ncbi:glycosyltransferase family 4 protein [Patescibacteria group bacterium]|nr:glycosyltransferase family 4 protein [Patescibacteria group bacterium]MBU1722134.1 glycosyltransferase family 4 protein [Patescibacteria group bacterium]MBU1901183.1 glycosyltransferase family 4 protein [Patescibacteria group bacterium]
MPKTLLITLDFPPNIGGVASYVAARVHTQKDIIVLAPNISYVGKEDRVYRRQVFFRFFWPKWLKTVYIALDIIKKEDIKHIEVHHVLPMGYVAYIICLLKKIPYTVYLHGTDVAYAKKKRFTSVVLQAAQRIVVNSQSLRDRVVEAWPQLKEVVTVVYPLPDAVFSKEIVIQQQEALRARLSLHGQTVVLSVSRLVEGKGFEQLISAMAVLMKKHPSLVWMIIGDGGKKNAYVDMCTQAGIIQKVRFLGALAQSDIPLYMSVADIFCLLPQAHDGKEEGFGLVFLEAALMGLPVVAGNSGGVKEAVIHNETGLLVDGTKEKEIVDAVEQYITDPLFRKKISTQALARVQQMIKAR